MKAMTLVALLAAVTAAAGCGLVFATPAPVTYTVVYGESFATTDEAVLEARNNIRNAATVGCKPVSIGSGGAGAAVETGGLLVNTVVLLECPQGAPDILAASGLPVR